MFLRSIKRNSTRFKMWLQLQQWTKRLILLIKNRKCVIDIKQNKFTDVITSCWFKNYRFLDYTISIQTCFPVESGNLSGQRTRFQNEASRVQIHFSRWFFTTFSLGPPNSNASSTRKVKGDLEIVLPHYPSCVPHD